MISMFDLDAEDIDEKAAFRAQVRALVWNETKRRLGIAENEHPHSPNALAPTSAAALRVHLMHLKVATEVGKDAHDLAADAAKRAGRAGASYADLGLAVDLTRQAARKRWPGAVGTQWVLCLLTGKSHPHGAVTQVFRSEEKAIAAGLTAVDEGAFADDGAVAAVVVDSSGQAVWACRFDSGTLSPQKITLPEGLQSVPATGQDGHGEWTYRWQQHIIALLQDTSG
ncbi:hypothetical protein ACFY5H_34490 [Streptomyces sp. NPDC013012]|uniref:hypothetical protein n=1 Tax=Streptomyces sp. NPDC013012 TaxID=3364860 RepID=UPI003682B32F